MVLATLSGPQDKVDEAIASFVIDRPIHPVSALETLGEKYKLIPYDTQNAHAALLQHARELMKRMDIEPAFAPFQDRRFSGQSAAEALEKISGQTESLLAERDGTANQIENNLSFVRQLEHLTAVDEELSDLFAMKYVKCRFVRVRKDHFDACYHWASSRQDIFLFPTGRDEQHVYGMYFALDSAVGQLDATFASMGFERIRILEQASFHGTAEETSRQLQEENARLQIRLTELDEELARLKRDNREDLLALFSYLKFTSGCAELRSLSGYRHGHFYVTGWVPAGSVEEYEALFRDRQDISCMISSVEDSAYAGEPPTKMHSGFLARVFRPLLEMYGLPAYDEVDPSVFMALSFILFFGIMFGDVGQGIGLIVIGFLLARFKKNWLGPIIMCCGVAATAFGFVYGSVFGFEEILPGFKILEGNHVTILLVLSLGLGVFMLCLVMVLNMVNGIRQHDWGKVLFGPNSLTGLVFYLGLILAAVGKLALGINLFKPAYVLIVLVLPVLLMLLSEPLHKLLKGDPDWKKIKLGSLLGSGFFEIFETLLSYLTNTLSFLRVGAYSITHVGLMLVVQMLAGSNMNPVVIVLGNLFVMGFEGFLVGIQVMRLEFYELFGRFYEDGGFAFKTKNIDYTV